MSKTIEELLELPEEEREALLHDESVNPPVEDVVENNFAPDTNSEGSDGPQDIVYTDVEDDKPTEDEVVEEPTEPEEEKVTETEDIPAENEVPPTETEAKIAELLDAEALKGKKAKVKYMGVESEIDGEQLLSLAQIGMDADNKGYKDAVKLKKDIEAKGLSTTDLDLLAKFKSGDTSVLKELVASSGLDVESFREAAYDFEQEHVDAVASTVNQQPTDFDTYVQSIPTEVHETYNKLAPTIPGLAEFQSRVSQAGDVDKMNSLVSVIAEGTFDEIAPMVANKYLQLNEYEKAQLKTNDKAFSQFYDSMITELDQAPQSTQESHVTEQVQEPTVESKPVSQRVSAADVASKSSMGKPSNKPVAMSTSTKEKSVEDILSDIENLSEEEYRTKYLNETV